MIRVVLVDDQELSRMGIRLALESDPEIAVVAEADDGRTGLAAIAEAEPDVVLMDIRMPGLDGVEATRIAVQADPAVRIVVLTTFDIDDNAIAAIKAGASGFLGKSSPPATLIRAVRAVVAGDAVLGPTALGAVLDRVRHGGQPPGVDAAGLAQLTPREVDVLTLIGRGLTNTEIAELLVVSVETVKTHVKRILSKKHLRDRVQAVLLAYDTGLVRPER